MGERSHTIAVKKKKSYQKFLSGDLCGGCVARGRVKVALGNQVLQHVNQSSARVGTGVHVNYIIRTTKLKQRLSLQILLKKYR